MVQFGKGGAVGCSEEALTREAGQTLRKATRACWEDPRRHPYAARGRVLQSMFSKTDQPQARALGVPPGRLRFKSGKQPEFRAAAPIKLQGRNKQAHMLCR